MPSVCPPMHPAQSVICPGKLIGFGVEVPSSVTWTGWEPGKDYTKKIVVKNLQVKSLHLKYSTPSSKVFTTLYPRPIQLAAGNSFTLPITFHPLEKINYEDKISFCSSEGTFTVPIKAVIPDFKIDVPAEVNFGNCSLASPTTVQFCLQNLSELFTPFMIETCEPFSIDHVTGTLNPCSAVTLTATFNPAFATVYEACILIRYGTDCGRVRKVKLTGAGKLPVIKVISSGCTESTGGGQQETTVEFGTVPVDMITYRTIELKNVGQVTAEFKIEHPLVGKNQIESVFKCDQKSGCIPVGQSAMITISYTGRTPGCHTVDYFYIETVGSPVSPVIKCVGKCVGPNLTFSDSRLNFKVINAGECATKTFDLVNNSDCDATFQFQIDCSQSVFKFDAISGVLPACSKKTFIVQFSPQHPITYMRRVECIVHHQGILILELMGTCHTELGQPALLKSIHVERYERIERRGLSLYSPETLISMLTSCQLTLDEIEAVHVVNNREGSGQTFHPMVDYMNDGHHNDRTSRIQPVSLDMCYVDFGKVDHTCPEVQMVSLTNHTNGRIFVAWTAGSSQVFQVSPPTAEITPQKSVPFRILFKPTEGNMLYGAQLECFALHKSSLNYQYTDDKTHFPPWCLTLTTTGHTFSDCSEIFLPRLTYDRTTLSFMTVNPSDTDYRSLVLTNDGDTPVLFDFERDPRRIFIQRPLKGILHPGYLQIFIVQFSLGAEGAECQQILRMNINDSYKHSQSIQLIGSLELPEISLDNCGMLYMKPTSVSMRSSRQYGVRNLSKIPLEYKWTLNRIDEANLKVEPATGIIHPNERQYHTWTFTPSCDKKYMIKPTLSVWTQCNADKRRVRKHNIRVLAEGTCGRVLCDPSSVDFGWLMCGTGHASCLQLSNSYSCELRYKLNVQHSVITDSINTETTNDIELSCYEGVLPGRSSTTILATVRPSAHLQYTWIITCQILDSTGEAMEGVDEYIVCELSGTGVYPSVTAVDIKGQGTAAGLSKKQLCRLFNLDQLNELLENDPDHDELIYKRPMRNSTDKRPEICTKAVTEFNFSSAPLGCEPFSVQIVLENPSPVTCNWSFLYPCDQQIELEYWAETGEYTMEELNDWILASQLDDTMLLDTHLKSFIMRTVSKSSLKVMENKLFTVEPKKGRLDSGQSCCVTLTYHHSMIATDRLPVLLKLNRGREVLINFVGVTVASDRPYLHFTSLEHRFAPVIIGGVRPPVQVYEMYNGGGVPVEYCFDLSPLSGISMENYSHPVFECLNPKGVVCPGCTALIEWRFSPLEAKTYTVDIDVVISEEERVNVRFIGVGVDERALGHTYPSNNDNNNNISTVQRMMLPKQLCFLSTDSLELCDVPLYSVSRRLVVLTNCSTLHGSCFSWHVTSDRDKEIVRVYPSRGMLGPGDKIVCKVMFTAIGQPAFYDIDIVCEITNREQYDKYVKAYNAWQAERARQAVEFTITEKDLYADLRLPEVDGEAACMEMNMEEYSTEPVLDLKYKTLPPIFKQQTAEEIRDKLRSRKRFDEKYWPQPEPPKSTILHLAIKARTHDLDDFNTRFPNSACNFFIDRTLQESCPRNPHEDGWCQLPVIPCYKSEFNMTEMILTSILRSLMDDDSFPSACASATMEPVPYYRQLTQPVDIHRNEVLNEIYGLSDSQYAVVCEPSTEAGSNGAAESAGHVTSDEAEQQPTSDEQNVGTESEAADQPSSAANESSPHTAAGQSELSANKEEEEVKVEVEPSDDSAVRPEGTEIWPAEIRHEKCRAEAASNEHQLVQRVKKHPVVTNTVESLLENTVMNILQEALNDEFNLTARPRLVALPPRAPTPRNKNPFKK